MKNSLNILTQQKQQEIDDKIKEKQNKEILQSLKKDYFKNNFLLK